MKREMMNFLNCILEGGGRREEGGGRGLHITSAPLFLFEGWKINCIMKNVATSVRAVLTMEESASKARNVPFNTLIASLLKQSCLNWFPSPRCTVQLKILNHTGVGRNYCFKQLVSHPLTWTSWNKYSGSNGMPPSNRYCSGVCVCMQYACCMCVYVCVWACMCMYACVFVWVCVCVSLCLIRSLYPYIEPQTYVYVWRQLRLAH